MRLPRFRLRTLLIAVAIVGLACGGEVMRRRRAGFLIQVEINAILAATARSPYSVAPRPLRASYYDRLRLKYERAARYPWLPVEPDPPEPE